MSGQNVRSGVGNRDTADYLGLAANALYTVAGVLFLLGLYYDWQRQGEILIAQFALADEPNANSGLFILAIIVLVIGYLVSTTADRVVEWQTEEVDQTQEWTVDVGESGEN